MQDVLTIGHSNHKTEVFVGLLRKHGITAVADVRSSPRTQVNPDYCAPRIKEVLHDAGLQYVFLGDELGARSPDLGCYENGRVVYARLARQPLFQQGLDRIVVGAATHRIALMCAEREPIECHRFILVARQLMERSVTVRHILGDGSLETHGETMLRLKRRLGLQDRYHLFQSSDTEVDNLAYEMQEARISFEFPEHKIHETWA